jgi:hypothetical protein
MTHTNIQREGEGGREGERERERETVLFLSSSDFSEKKTLSTVETPLKH